MLTGRIEPVVPALVAAWSTDFPRRETMPAGRVVYGLIFVFLTAGGDIDDGPRDFEGDLRGLDCDVSRSAENGARTSRERKTNSD